MHLLATKHQRILPIEVIANVERQWSCQFKQNNQKLNCLKDSKNLTYEKQQAMYEVKVITNQTKEIYVTDGTQVKILQVIIKLHTFCHV